MLLSHEELGQLIANTFGLDMSTTKFEENCGTVWAIAEDGTTYAISMMQCEGTEGQDRDNYTDEQDRDNYTVN